MPTLKTAPGKGGHNLLLRGGFIRQSSAGIYSFLPLGLLVLERLQNMIDKEMNSIGAHKVKLPHLLSSDAWKITGRWGSNEMYKFEDRKGSQYCLGPTHEEEITQVAADLVSSYKDLPLYLYQIGTKFRDEKRPRGGLLRGKEFTMKDLYTFDIDDAAALQTYEKVRDAYKRFFNSLGLLYKEAMADSGNIGGDKSHEYHLLSPVGEDTILHCPECNYSSNMERAQSLIDPSLHKRTLEKLDSSIFDEKFKEISNLFSSNVSIKMGIVKENGHNTLLGMVTPKGWEINPIKVSKLISKNGYLNILAENEDLKGVKVDDVQLLVDSQVQYLKNLNFSPAINLITADIILSKDGDFCKSCYSQSKTSVLKASAAIEVGHAFFLGEKYSLPLKSTFKTQKGTDSVPSMGCFGLGVSRLIGAIAEISRDKDGIIWPACIAPADICIIVSPSKDPEENLKLNSTCDILISKIDNKYDRIVLDDRNHSFPHKLKDALLIGYPKTIVIGKSFLRSGQLEVFNRHDPKVPSLISLEEFSII